MDRPRHYWRDQLRQATRLDRARIAVASVVLGKRAWQSLSRHIIEEAVNWPAAAERQLERCRAEREA